MNAKEYNGWTNYETWCVKLWMDNDKGSQEYFAGLALDHYQRDRPAMGLTKENLATISLAQALKEHHEEALPGLGGFVADMLNAAMSEVSWHEIAKYLVDEVIKEEVALEN